MLGVPPDSPAATAAPEARGRLRELVSLATRPHDVWLGVRMATWRLALPILKRTVPLPRLIRLMYRRGDLRGQRQQAQSSIARLAWIVYAVGFRHSNDRCLARSLVVYRYLSTAGLQPQLVVGVRKDCDQVAGHAWVVLEGEPVGDTRAALAAFTPILVFGVAGMPESVGPAL